MLYNVQITFIYIVWFDSFNHGNCSYEIVCLAHRLDLHCYKSIAIMVLVCEVSVINRLPCPDMKGDVGTLENRELKP